MLFIFTLVFTFLPEHLLLWSYVFLFTWSFQAHLHWHIFTSRGRQTSTLFYMNTNENLNKHFGKIIYCHSLGLNISGIPSRKKGDHNSYQTVINLQSGRAKNFSLSGIFNKTRLMLANSWKTIANHLIWQQDVCNFTDNCFGLIT